MLKKIISYIITFIIIIVAILITLTGVIRTTILSENYLLSVLEEQNYYKNAGTRINDAFGNYILQSGLEPEILNELVTQEKIKHDIQEIISALYTNNKYEISTSDIKKELNSRIDKVIEENNKKLNAEEKQSIENFVTSITDAYETEIAYSISAIDEIGGVLYKIINVVSTVILVLVVIEVLLVLIVWGINRKGDTPYIGIGLLASGVMLLTPQIVASLKMRLQNILMFNEDFSQVIRAVVQEILQRLDIIGGILILLGIILIVVKTRKK